MTKLERERERARARWHQTVANYDAMLNKPIHRYDAHKGCPHCGRVLNIIYTQQYDDLQLIQHIEIRKRLEPATETRE